MTAPEFVDRRNHQITANVAEAGLAVSAAMENFIQKRSDVVPQLQKAIELDPECALAHACLGLMMHGAKHIDLKPKVGEALARATERSTGISEREMLYLKALEYADRGELYDSVSCFEKILDENPTDLFALSLCQGELFWLGDMKRSLAASAGVAKAWSQSVPGFSDYLGVHAFDLEEAGEFQRAESAGREAVDIRPNNIWATHAIAHVMYMQRRTHDGIEWIESLQDNWDGLNQMQFHLWWHKSLFYLELGEHEAILAAYDNWIRNRQHQLVQSMPDLYIDLQNGSSMLWRLEHMGVDVGDRWNEMAQLVEPRVGDLSNPFTSAHFAIILAAVGDFDACEQLVKEMSDYSEQSSDTLSARYRDSALPAAAAAIAHRQGKHSEVVRHLKPARHDIWMMGGSHAQQDLFFQILLDSTAKTGDKAGFAALIDEIEKIGFTEPAQRAAYDLMVAQKN